MATREPLTFDVGVMWEENPWEVRFDQDIRYGPGRCKHCSEARIETTTRYDGSTFDTVHWTCPRVIVVKNEGGCNTTGLCLDCVLEASYE